VSHLGFVTVRGLTQEKVGYSVLALNQVAYKRVDPKSHANILDGLLAQLKKRDGIALLKRLTIVLDEDSEKGFGLVSYSNI
jgi:ribonuclease P/MRP protein subunit RPP1